MRRSVFVLACLLWPGPASAQVWVATDGGVNSDPASGTTLAMATPITAGTNGAIVVCGFNSGGQTITGVTDGTHTYTPLTARNQSDAFARIFYTLATSAGSYTPVVAFGGATAWRGITAVVYSHTGTAAFVTENGGNGSSASILGGTLTTTGSSDLLTVACATSLGLVAQSAHAINSTTPSGVAPTSLNQTYWDLRNHSSATGGATATVAGGDNWVVVSAAFSSASSSSSTGPNVGSVASAGAGR